MTSQRSSKTVQRTRDKLTQHLGPLTTTHVPRPHTGWIRATREALGMTATQLAVQLGVNKSGIGRLEEAERTGSIKLDTLRLCAEAMDCTLVYAIVPNGDYENVINERVEAAATEVVERTLHAMVLENQSPDAASVERIRERARNDLIERGEVWGRSLTEDDDGNIPLSDEALEGLLPAVAA